MEPGRKPPDSEMVRGRARCCSSGVAKLVRWHPEMLPSLDAEIRRMKVVSENENTIQLDSDTHHATLRKNLFGKGDRRWLLTGYEKKASSAGSRMDIPGARGEGWQTTRPGDAPATKLPPFADKVNGPDPTERYAMQAEPLGLRDPLSASRPTRRWCAAEHAAAAPASPEMGVFGRPLAMNVSIGPGWSHKTGSSRLSVSMSRTPPRQ
jgi:hypothetical protein